jgi:hypothetical protein
VSLKFFAALGATLLTLTACSSMSSPSNPTPAADPMSAFTGNWRSTATSGACTSMDWVVAQTGATTATIAYTATCAGLPVAGTASGTLNGTTMNWATVGTAGAACGFTLNGTAVPSTVSTDLTVAYTGNVCGSPVNGGDTLHR